MTCTRTAKKIKRILNHVMSWCTNDFDNISKMTLKREK